MKAPKFSLNLFNMLNPWSRFETFDNSDLVYNRRTHKHNIHNLSRSGFCYDNANETIICVYCLDFVIKPNIQIMLDRMISLMETYEDIMRHLFTAHDLLNCIMEKKYCWNYRYHDCPKGSPEMSPRWYDLRTRNVVLTDDECKWKSIITEGSIGPGLGEASFLKPF
jgi:hypothetical protein